MTAGRPSPALVGGVAVLERAIAYTLGGLAAVTPDALGSPTPCTAWNLHDLLAHLHDSMAALQEGAETGRVSYVAFPAGDDLLSRVRDRAAQLLGAWANADGDALVWVHGEPMTAPLMATAGAIEVTIHGWDVAVACGLHRPIPDDLADELLELSTVLIRDADRPGRFGPPVPVPTEAAPGDRLLAFLGRSPSLP
jgi:uncharacterized protein (TIGR03086 family)